MSILGWLIIGAIAGFVASKIMRLEAANYIGDIVLGVAAALVGGWVALFIDGGGFEEFDFYSMFGSAVGGALVLIVYHVIWSGTQR